MRIQHLLILLLSVLLFAGPTLAGDKNKAVSNRDRAADVGTHGKDAKNADVTYGRIKELDPGQKLVVDVDNAMDKSFDLTDRDVSMKLATGLKVGDPVKITERNVNGKKRWCTS
ncbi:MAG TPA: hypothetical protein VN442_04995 [Bryobacteraceae bacterium]|nr:hypothetical protein [Bryobacteraceae bacterium]